MWHLGAEDVDDLALGAALVGSGGGGSTRAAASLLRRLLARTGPVRVVSPAELPDDTWTVPVGLVGSVTVFEEKPLNGTEFAGVARGLEQYCDVTLGAVVCFEAAGANALVGPAAAATLGLPLVDADGMGRAYPGLEQTTFYLGGASLAPVVVADVKGSVQIIDGVDGPAAERLARAAVVAVGGWGLIGLAPQRVDVLSRTAIRRTVWRALDIGRTLAAGRPDAAVRAYGGRTLLHGKVADVDRSPGTRYGFGTAVLESTVPPHDVRLEFQNENLLLIADGDVLACVPDLICLLDRDRRRSLTTEEIRFGLEVDVLTLPGAPQWRSPRGLGLVGPRAFGYDVEYTVPGAAR